MQPAPESAGGEGRESGMPAFLWLDSIRVRAMWGVQSFRGRPGNPAPEPMSATESILPQRAQEDTEKTGETGGGRVYGEVASGYTIMGLRRGTPRFKMRRLNAQH